MGALLVYAIKSALCLTLFYLFYKLLLSRETFYRFNRAALLCILCIALVLPFCRASISAPVQQLHETVSNLEAFITQTNDTAVTLEDNIPNIQEAASWSWGTFAILIYCIGVAFFFLRNIYSLLRMLIILRRYEVEKLANGTQLIAHNLPIAPFSWMKYIVVSESDIKDSGDEILRHEMAHISHLHSLDLLVAELFSIFQWFSPATWLIKQELQYIHEYEADSSVLKSGIDAKKYQLLLIKKAVGTLRFNSMTNSFNHSKLKKRITMMLKERSNPWAKLRYVYILPLVAVAVTTFANPKVSSALDEISSFEVSEFSSYIEENEYVYTPERLKDVGCTILLDNDNGTMKDTLKIYLVTYFSTDYVYCLDNISKKEVMYVQVSSPKQEVYETNKIKLYAYPCTSENEELKVVWFNKETKEEITLISNKKDSIGYKHPLGMLEEEKQRKKKSEDTIPNLSVIGSSLKINKTDNIAAVFIDGEAASLEEVDKIKNKVGSVSVKADKNSEFIELYIKTKDDKENKSAPLKMIYE